MSARSGLGPLEVAALAAVADVGGTPDAARRRTTRVLDRLEREDGLGARYLYPLLQDLGAPWRLHLPLLDPYGNWGSRYGDPAADAQYTSVRLSPVGALALAAERGELGPVPLGLVEGSLYRGGPVPPFDPRRVVTALRTASGDAGPPALPTGGTVGGDVTALLAGRRARLQLGCEVVHEDGALVLTAVPVGVPLDLVEQCLSSRVRSLRWDGGAPAPADEVGAVDVRDETSMHVGVRIVVRLAPGADRSAVERWVRSVWPVTTEVDCRLPAPTGRRLRTWDRGDGSGLDALEALLARDRP